MIKKSVIIHGTVLIVWEVTIISVVSGPDIKHIPTVMAV